MTATKSKDPRRPDKIDAVIGRNLKALRKQSRFAMSEVAKAADVSIQQLQMYETGKNRLSARTLLSFKRLFEVPFDRFYNGIDYDRDWPFDMLGPDEQKIIQRVMTLDMTDRVRIWRVIEAVLG